MSKDDSVFVGHMLDTAQKISAKVAGASRSQFDDDENLRMAVVHLIQTIGEAAPRVSQPYHDAHPEIPWKAIIGMRHRVVHDYLEVDYDIVWDVATVNLPPLIVELEKLVPPILP